MSMKTPNRNRKSIENELGRTPTRIEKLAYAGGSPEKFFAFMLLLITSVVIILLLTGVKI
jgi:hypothetical protein